MRGTRASACCPAHEDHDPSLSVDYQRGRVLLHCHAGCDAQDVLAALGLGWEALFDEPPDHDVKVTEYRYQRPDGTTHMTVERWRTPTRRKTFKQRGANGADMTGTRPCLYNLPVVIPHARDGGDVWVVEGEKDVHALRRLGVVATTAPMGVGKWREYYWTWLKGASTITVVADGDEPGRKGAAQVAADLRGHGFTVRTVLAAEGCKDAFDHVAAGHTADEFRVVNLNRLRPEGTNYVQLRERQFPAIRWAVEGMIPSGLTLLAGPPKVGKSMLALDIALGVACGGWCLGGGYRCASGSVLYLSLDNDSERRLQLRCNTLLGESDCHPDIEFHTVWPTHSEALAACREWITESGAPRMIVVDTLVRVEPEFDCGGERGGMYSHATDVLSGWARLADDADITVLAVHHDRKPSMGDGDDWINRFTGSRGVTATASTLAFLDAKRGSRQATLHLTGRDIETEDVSLTWRSGWTVTEPSIRQVHTVADLSQWENEIYDRSSDR